MKWSFAIFTMFSVDSGALLIVYLAIAVPEVIIPLLSLSINLIFKTPYSTNSEKVICTFWSLSEIIIDFENSGYPSLVDLKE